MVESDSSASRAAIHALLVDGLNLIRRVYAAQPGDDGAPRAAEARSASVQSLARALREAQPTHAVVVFEGRGPTWRHQAFPGYKAGHKPMPEALRLALPAFRDAFADLGVRSFAMPAAEADDVIATLATKIRAAGGRATILSTDKAFLQLVSPRVRVRDHFANHDFDRAAVVDRFGVAPEALVDLLGLAGDSSNSIHGVPGVGPKTAARLLADYGSLEWVLAAAAGAADLDDDLPPLTPRLGERLRTHAADARLAQTLVRLRTDLDLGLTLRALRYQPAAATRRS